MASFPVPTYAAELGHGFPFDLFTSHKVPKVCTACGTTRTPQWREGPEGPKTLCNACGVKRCRQLRLTSDGKRKPAVRAPEAHDELEEEDTHSADLPVQKLPRKVYAKGFSAWRAPDSESRDTPAPSISGGTLGPAASSDSAEEEFWSPHGPAPCSPTYAAIGTDSAAAINLLAMHFDPAAAAQHHHSHGTMLPAKQGSHDSEGCSLPQAAEAGLGGAREPQQPRLHPNHQLLLQLHELERQARVAEAAVPAVAQVLAQKQAVATQARFALVQCQKRARLLFESS